MAFVLEASKELEKDTRGNRALQNEDKNTRRIYTHAWKLRNHYPWHSYQ